MPTEKEKHLYELEEDLAPWLPRENDMNVLLSAAAEGSSTLAKEIKEVERALTLQRAETKAEIEDIGYPAQLSSKPSEDLEVYRNRVLQNYQLLTRNGSPEDILEFAVDLLDVKPSDVRLEEIDGAAKFRIIAPITAVESAFGSKSFATESFLNSTGASYGVEIVGNGTLAYITPSERTNNNYDSSNGYATLDGDGNITSGGTYSSYFEG